MIAYPQSFNKRKKSHRQLFLSCWGSSVLYTDGYCWMTVCYYVYHEFSNCSLNLWLLLCLLYFSFPKSLTNLPLLVQPVVVGITSNDCKSTVLWEYQGERSWQAKQEHQAEGCERHHDTHANVWLWSLESIEEAAVKGASHADEGTEENRSEYKIDRVRNEIKRERLD